MDGFRTIWPQVDGVGVRIGVRIRVGIRVRIRMPVGLRLVPILGLG